ncbi:uncharacterized protein LOC128720031 [Anopheles nili]|uniref:uncharacterized protein LOC128720031 n=1 Tax=Anopheles nili TaxID=185578 RepID=UPI00237B2556|nr:uncharacterized protein LOC128720031 [Anopheles nili]
MDNVVKAVGAANIEKIIDKTSSNPAMQHFQTNDSSASTNDDERVVLHADQANKSGCAFETPTTDRNLFRLQKCSTKIFGLSPVSEIAAALQDSGLNSPKLSLEKLKLIRTVKEDKFQHVTDESEITSSTKCSTSKEQLPNADECCQNLDNVDGDIKDDGSSQWQQQQDDAKMLNHSRFTLNSAGRSPATRRAEQLQRSTQRRQHIIPQRIIYDDGCKMLGSPSKDNLPTEELSFYQSHSPQQSPRPCSPCTLCPEDPLGGELLPSENNSPTVAIPIGIKHASGPIVGGKQVTTGTLGYRLRRPLDDHDPNSMDSGYGASVLSDVLMSSIHSSSSSSSTISSTGGSSGLIAPKSHSIFQFSQQPSASSVSMSRHSSTSPSSARSRFLHSSLSSGSMESMDEMELFDMEAMEDDELQGASEAYGASHQHAAPHQALQSTMLPSGLSSLICGTIKTTRTSNTPEQKRPFVRRCLSLTENTNNKLNIQQLQHQQQQQQQQQHAGVVATQLKTPERFCRRMIATEDQENYNLTPFATRPTVGSPAEVTRCFKRPEPPGISPVQSKRSKTQSDSMATVVSVFDSPARTTVLAAVPKKVVYQKSISMNDAQIMTALSRSSSEPDLIGDFSKSYVLPLMDGQHRDLKSISGDTMARLVRGSYNDKIASFKIIDCRYPYEFEGGHIRGAKNLYTQEQIIEELIKSKAESPVVTGNQDGPVRRHIIVFHCEFSSERGPKLSRFLRNHDRILNADSYPALHYPEMYLLHGGYKDFFKAHAELCDPIAYRPMLDPEFGDAYRHFRAKSRSWNGDGTGTIKAAATSGSLNGGPSRLTKSRSRLML